MQLKQLEFQEKKKEREAQLRLKEFEFKEKELAMQLKIKELELKGISAVDTAASRRTVIQSLPNVHFDH